jgi:hypothetical protein
MHRSGSVKVMTDPYSVSWRPKHLLTVLQAKVNFKKYNLLVTNFHAAFYPSSKR